MKRTVVLLTLLLALPASWLLWSAWAYRDIPVVQLVERYGGDNLHRVDLDGVELYYRLDGPPAGTAPALLLIHSHFFNSRMWDGWIPELSRHFRIVRFDMTSHGLTGPDPSGDYSTARSLALMQGLMQHLAIDEFAIVGSSLGGKLAFHYAATYPDQVTDLVLINAGGIPREQSSRGNAEAIPSWIDKLFYVLPRSTYRRFLNWMMVDSDQVNDELVREFHEMFRREGNRQSEFQRMRSYQTGDADAVLAAVRAPTLILWGGANPQLPPALAAEFERRLSAAPWVQTRIYPQAGHVLPLELPRQTARDVWAFLWGGEHESGAMHAQQP